MDGLLCHCRMNPDGHVPGEVLDCEAIAVPRARVAPFTLRGVALRDHRPSEVAAGIYRELARHARGGARWAWTTRAGRASHASIESPWFQP